MDTFENKNTENQVLGTTLRLTSLVLYCQFSTVILSGNQEAFPKVKDRDYMKVHPIIML